MSNIIVRFVVHITDEGLAHVAPDESTLDEVYDPKDEDADEDNDEVIADRLRRYCSRG